MSRRVIYAAASVGILILAAGAWYYLRAREERLGAELFDRMVQQGNSSEGRDPEDVMSFIREHPGLADRQFPRFVERPLHRAAKNGWGQVCGLLIDCGADITAFDHAGKRPLYWATYSQQIDKYPKVADLLIRRGADVNALDKDGYTVLHHAAGNGSLAAVRFLVEHGADVLIRSKEGTTCVDEATSMKYKFVDGDIASGKLLPKETLTPGDEERRTVYLYLRSQEQRRAK